MSLRKTHFFDKLHIVCHHQLSKQLQTLVSWNSERVPSPINLLENKYSRSLPLISIKHKRQGREEGRKGGREGVGLWIVTGERTDIFSVPKV